MTQGSDQAAGGAGAGTPPAPKAAAGAARAMTLASILTVASILLLFVFFVVGILALQYCINAWDRESQQQAEQSRRRRRRRAPRTTAAGGGSGRGGAMMRTGRGVDPELLRSLPVTVYYCHGGSDKAGDAAAECAVCLAELQDGEAARFLPRCGHGFHVDCVDTWLASHTTCPLCRLTVSKPGGGVSPHPAPSLRTLPRIAPEPANYAADLPASVLLVGVSGHGAVTAGAGSSRAAAMVIEIPELAVPTPPTLTPRDPAKSSPGSGSARLRSIRRLWSFGRQGAGGATSSCSCAGAGAGSSEEYDLEQGTS